MAYNLGMEIGIIVFLAALLVVREFQNRAERRDLMDRIMCRDYEEYKRFAKPAAARHVVYPAMMSDEQLAAAAEEERKKS